MRTLVAALVIVFSFMTFAHVTKAHHSKTYLNVKQAQTLINNYRSGKGLKRLRINNKLTRAARRHATYIADRDTISHDGPSKGWFRGRESASDRVTAAGYKWFAVLENVATGQKSIHEVMRMWKASPGHNENLLSDLPTEMGIALVKRNNEYGTFWVLVMARPL